MSELRISENPTRAYDANAVAEILSKDGSFSSASKKLDQILNTRKSLGTYFKENCRDHAAESLREHGAKIKPVRKGMTYEGSI